jgi:hypothetical protein
MGFEDATGFALWAFSTLVLDFFHFRRDPRSWRN